MTACFLVAEVVAGLREEYFRQKNHHLRKVISHLSTEIFDFLEILWKKNWPDSGYVFAQEKTEH